MTNHQDNNVSTFCDSKELETKEVFINYRNARQIMVPECDGILLSLNKKKNRKNSEEPRDTGDGRE